jgi:hypothetical protein
MALIIEEEVDLSLGRQEEPSFTWQMPERSELAATWRGGDE